MALETIELEDVAACVAAGRNPRPQGPYRVQVGNGDLTFDGYRIDDPVPTGRQLLDLVSARPAEEHLVFQLLRNGDLKELTLDETVDLRTAGIERFIVFKSAESYRIELDGQVKEWGACVISGRVLLPRGYPDAAPDMFYAQPWLTLALSSR